MEQELDPRYGSLIFDNIPHGIFTVDAHRRITSFNRAAEEITGWASEEAVGRKCDSIFNSNHCAGRCFLFNSIEQGEPHRDCEVLIVKRDGTEIPVAVSTASLKNRQGQIVGGIEMFRDLTEVNILRQELEGSYRIGDIVSKSAAMKGVRELLPLVARSDSTVLIEGEPGTGKELVARAIHNMGPRRDRPFIGVNCGAIPDTLVESELFGHLRGAFTDAKKDKPGRFAAAQGGTLLLDEVGDISAAVQVKLLRVLQEREYVPLGSSEPIKADVRILAATNRDLSHEAMNGRFRQDLYFRLRVVEIVVPPLRERRGDIEALAQHLLARIRAETQQQIHHIHPEAMRAFQEYDWPGNVRELENALTRACILARGATLGPEHLRLGSDRPEVVEEGAGEFDLSWGSLGGLGEQSGTMGTGSGWTLDSAIGRQVLKVLRHTGWNKSEAARLLEISRSRLARLIEKFDLEDGDDE